jgi:DNA-binding transcriptional LysR family regulator
MIDMQQMKHVLALAEHRNFHRAAKAVHLSQPALSKSIQRLEQDYGVKLFDRGPNSVTPTPFGRAVMERARRITAEAAEIQRDVDLLLGSSRGHFSLGAGPIAAEWILAPAVGQIVGKHPDLTISTKIDYSVSSLESLEMGEIDLYVGDVTEAKGVNRFEVIELPRLPIIMFCRPDHPLLQKSRIKIPDLQKYPLVGPKLPTRAYLWFGDRPLRKEEEAFLAGPWTVECDHFAFLKQIVRSSLSISGAPRDVIRDDLEKGILADLQVVEPKFTPHGGIARTKHRTALPGVDALVSEILAMARSWKL